MRTKNKFVFKRISALSLLALFLGILLFCFSYGSILKSTSDAPEIVFDVQENVNITTPTETTELTEQLIDTNEDVYVGKYFTEEEVILVAQTLWAECRGVKSTTEQACVAWTVVNRVDGGYSKTIAGVIKSPHAFAWSDDSKYSEELYDLAKDVLIRWSKEKDGETNVGRVLPKGYYWFLGDGEHNYFRNQYKGNYVVWDYSLPSPYDD